IKYGASGCSELTLTSIDADDYKRNLPSQAKFSTIVLLKDRKIYESGAPNHQHRPRTVQKRTENCAFKKPNYSRYDEQHDN
ncbi:MAG: hypothetical protein NWQ13_02945, partial [Glaciimonas sp.]|nr:hypothetical protein [Glaciimonas sp.]